MASMWQKHVELTSDKLVDLRPQIERFCTESFNDCGFEGITKVLRITSKCFPLTPTGRVVVKHNNEICYFSWLFYAPTKTLIINQL